MQLLGIYFLSCVFMSQAIAESPHELSIVPIYGVSEQPRYIAMIQRAKNQDATQRAFDVCVIGDLEHPQAQAIEYDASAEHRNGVQKVRTGEQTCYIKRDREGGEAHVMKVDTVSAEHVSLNEQDTNELKRHIKRVFGRYNNDENPTIVLIKRKDNFDELIKLFMECRAVIGLSPRTVRTPYTFYMIFDKDVALDQFLEEARTRIDILYQNRLKEIESKMPLGGIAVRSHYQAQAARLHQQLKYDVLRAHIAIDDAHELLRHGHKPVFVAYQKM